MATFDYTTDGGCLFLSTLKEAGALPDWVGHIPDCDDVSGLPSSSFADTERRLFPLHSKEAAFLSAASALVYGETGPACLNRIKTACYAYGIVDHVKAAHEALAPEYHDVSDGESEKFACALELVSDGKTLRLYPIHSRDHVEMSATKLAADMAEERLPRSWFAPAARAIVKAASDLGLPLHYVPEAVLALGEDRVPSREMVEAQLQARKSAGVCDTGMALYREAADAVVAGSMCKDDGSLVWEVADRKFGISKLAGIKDPVVVFNSGIMTAEFDKRADAVFMLQGVMIPNDGLRAVSEQLLAASFSKEAAVVALRARESGGLEATSLLKNLNDTDQQLLLRLLCNSAGKAL